MLSEQVQRYNTCYPSCLESSSNTCYLSESSGNTCSPDISEPEIEEEDSEEEEFSEALFKRVDELELSVRSQNCLQNAGIEYIYQLVDKTEAEMLKTKNFGRKSLNEIKEILADLNLALGMKLHNFPKHKVG